MKINQNKKMIKIDKTSNIPDSLTNEKFKKHFKKFSNNKVKVSGIYYRAKDVVESLKNEYNNKCAYCETKDFNPEIEHYRPKSKYKYLSYEWSNLMPACSNCNNSKSNKFPVKNEISIEELKKIGTNLNKLNEKEQPYILNPETDNLKEHFTFNTFDEIYSNTKKGKITICVCKLNDETLIHRRQKAYNSILDIVKMAKLNNDTIGKEALHIINEKIKTNQKAEGEYSLFWQNVAINLEI